MSLKNVQFSVATHIAAVLASQYGKDVTSAVLSGSVNAEPTFVRRAIAKLAKAGLIKTSRGKNGACTLARHPDDISLLDIYRACQAPVAIAIHGYAAQPICPISVSFKDRMADVLEEAQLALEARLADYKLSSLVDAIRTTSGIPPKFTAAA